jgi:transcription antitermination factor NusG
MEEGEQRWIAVYTRARSERSVARQLEERGLTSFVPLQRRLHKWSDRSKWVEQPLIPSYVFVLLSPPEHHRLFDIPGFVRVIMFNGRVAVVRPVEIELLRRTEHHPEAEVVGFNQLTRGESVQIIGGLFAGYAGVVVHSEADYRVAVSIEELSYAVVVSVQATDVKVT